MRTFGVVASLLLGCTSGPAEDFDGGFDADLSCAFESVVIERVFEPNCGDSRCHDSNRPRAGLDLVSTGLAQRLINEPSRLSECGEPILVVPGVARASFLMDKVLGSHGDCGDSMPPDETLSLEDQRCLVEWIDSMPFE